MDDRNDVLFVALVVNLHIKVQAQRLLTRNLEKLTMTNNKGIENPEIVRYVANKLSRILEKLEEK